ncbi:Rieske (2Fe-2S) protein [Pedobacter sp.]|uniref:Rieske (2Fe-2S) protein n=1 Tax=Pedobacter sp. TaxID=1411316 RepID=UPI003D7F3451
MLKWHKIPIEIPNEDFVQQINVGGRKLCLVKNKGEVFVLANVCPHAGGILSNGWCKNGQLVCPVHRREYDLKTGRGAEGQGDYINVFPVENRSDGLYIGLKESWLSRMFKGEERD